MTTKPPGPHGRGSHLNPVNRFTLHTVEPDFDSMGDEEIAALGQRETVYRTDSAVSVISENQSPDIPFRYSLNPYRGCLHGCTYCYSRPTHEYLGLNAGLDFESIIFVKEDAHERFREWLSRPKYVPESVTLSGVTDPYQPIERDKRITRRCLEVALEARQPLSFITKNALITRDADLLVQMAERRLVHVTLAVTTLDADLARSMEPRTSTPAARLRAVSELANAGVPVRVLIAPVVPGLTDEEMPAILEAAKAAGASAAGYTMLRLPGSVEAVFLEWLLREQPGKYARVLTRIRETRDGKLSDPRFGTRMTGVGFLAEQIRSMFKFFARRHGLDGDLPAYDTNVFRPPGKSGQGWLF